MLDYREPPCVAEWIEPESSWICDARAESLEKIKEARELADALGNRIKLPSVASARGSLSNPSPPLEERFSVLADKWSHDTAHISSVTDLINDQSYQQIINMGTEALPYLLGDLDRNKRFWFPALASITGLRPFDTKDMGNYQLMAQAWLRWGRRRGLI